MVPKNRAVRAVLAFLLLPGVVAFLVPLLLAQSGEDRPFRWISLVLLAPGAGLLIWCAREFHARGKGTLAPWDPPRHLVFSGAYRFSRNPMYLAIGLILIGWAIGYSSGVLLLYAVVVIAACHVRVLVSEEPIMARAHREEWKHYAGRVPRWVFPSRRAVAGAWLAVLVIVPLGGLIYEAYADGMAAREFTPPGMLVDIGGRRLHLLCIGEGEPTVFFESSGFGTALSSSRARERISSRTRVCSYDRSGTGWSDPAPGAVTTGDLARDLAVLQDRAGLRAPYVIVASSIGGLTAELFARQFPERVAGLVFVDAANSVTLTLRESASGWVKPAACVASVLAHFGVVRVLDPFEFGVVGTEGAKRGAALAYNSRPWVQMCAMARGLDGTLRQFAEAPPLRPAIPVTVLSASTTVDLMPPAVLRVVNVEELRAAVRGSHEQFAKRSTQGKWLVVPDSTHLIGNSQPDAVADAVIEMLDSIR